MTRRSSPPRPILKTVLWCAAGLAVAVALWDGPPEPGPPMVGSTADAEWPPEIAPYTQRPRHGPFP